MQRFGATLKFDPNFFSVKWDNSKHFGGVFNENVNGMYWHVENKNDAFKFSKPAKATNST